MSSKPKTQTTESTAQVGPLEEQKPYWLDLWSKSGSALDATNNKPFTGEFIAGPTGTQTQGFDLAKAAAGGANFGATDLKTMGQRIASGEFLNVNNPVFQNAATAAINPLRDAFTSTVLPGITDAAIKGGAYGGTSQDELELRAANDFTRSAGDITSKMALQNLETQSKLLPNAIPLIQAGVQSELAPGNTMMQLGGVEQGWVQQALQNELMKYQNELESPWFGLDQMAKILSAGGFKNQNSTTTQTQAAPDTATQWMQGIMGGLGVATSLMGMPGMGAMFPGVAGGMFSGGGAINPFANMAPGAVNVMGAAGGYPVPTYF